MLLMAEPMAPSQIFDSRLRQLRLQRAAKRMAKTGLSFLLGRCLDDAAERILDINRHFGSALLIADFDVRAELTSRLPTDKHPQTFHFSEPDNQPIPEGSFDLVLNLMTLHSRDNPPDDIAHMARYLKEDGLFIAAFFGGDTLTELRQSLYKTDDEIFGGAAARIAPMVTYSQAAPLITRAGLNLPVVDMDRFNVKYSRFEKLLADLRDIGVTNILLGRSAQTLTGQYLQSLTQNYRQMFGEDDRLKASFEVLWLTGWAPHPSQQKPLKPGSAKMPLAEVLKPKKTP